MSCAGGAEMSDLLSAASLLLTVLGIVYGTWYPEITQAIDVEIPGNKPNRIPVRRKVHRVLWAKSFPLAVSAIAVTIVFIPDALAIAAGGLGALREKGLGAFPAYSAVQAAFCVVVVLTGVLAMYLFCLACALKAVLRKIDA